MSLIDVSNLTFSYDSYYENVFENATFQIDTDWKLGFTGRNGRGKTTFLNLLLGKFDYQGTISSSVDFDYFPFSVDDINRSAFEVIKESIAPFNKIEEQMNRCLEENTKQSLSKYSELLECFVYRDGYRIDNLIEKEIAKLDISNEVLQRPFSKLSNGEQTKLLLAGLFLKKNNFLLIDEPTNHLDSEGREVLIKYLKSKKGFILVSHDRYFLDNIVDHILAINKAGIEIQKGNFSTWQLNKDRRDNFERAENNKLKKDIGKLKAAAKQTSDWSDRVEKSKFTPSAIDRGYLGHKAAKMMKRSKSIEQRQSKAIENKSNLLKNIEQADTLRMNTLSYHEKKLVEIIDLSIQYDNFNIFDKVNLIVDKGDRIALCGGNGSGKSSILKLIMGAEISYTGICKRSNGIDISYIPQDTSFLKGGLKEFAQKEGLDESLFKTNLYKLDFSREQFEKNMEDYSAGQKKKVLLAKSLSQPAHLFVWDEPLNFVDVISRIQLERLILQCNPTMIFVEHDTMFNKNIATKTIQL